MFPVQAYQTDLQSRVEYFKSLRIDDNPRGFYMELSISDFS